MTNRISTIFDKIPSFRVASPIDTASGGRSYAQLSTILYSVMIVITILPMLIVGWRGYENYSNVFTRSEREQLEWKLDGKIKSIEHMVTSLKSVVQFTARRDRFIELTEGRNLEELFVRIQNQYAFFADLGVIDQNGVQRAYYGPYDLHGADYSQEEWFREVFESGVYISDVYTGYRKVPHFAIAVSNLDPNTRKLWVLRATIDASTLQEFIDTIKTNATDDLFLVNRDGVLQTSSGYYGKTLGQFGAPVEPGIHHRLSSKGEDTFEAIGEIRGTPWSLVLLKKSYVHLAEWHDFRRRIIIIIGTSIILSIMVVHGLVRMLVGLIRKTDEMQISILKDAEHTGKLASIGRLAAGVGHEINNPLAIISQKAGLIEDLLELSPEFDYKETIGKNLSGINQSVDRCKAITHRLLGFARRTDVSLEPVRINDIIDEVLQFLNNAMFYSRIKLQLNLQDDLQPVESDRLQLQQVFLNVINNAIDAIGKDGTITITSHKVAGDVRVVIQDDGPGIDQKILPNIFEPFYTTKEPGKGTGLGLSITYGLLKKLGGDITVRSEVGEGTAFTITIPVHRKSNGENSITNSDRG